MEPLQVARAMRPEGLSIERSQARRLDDAIAGAAQQRLLHPGELQRADGQIPSATRILHRALHPRPITFRVVLELALEISQLLIFELTLSSDLHNSKPLI